MKTLSFVTLGLLLAAGTVSAQKPDDKKAPGPAVQAGPPPAPKPAAQMDQFKFLVGKWKCDGKQFVGFMGPEHAFTATLEVRNDGDGFYQSWLYEEKASKVHMGGRLQGVWGWNRVDGKFVRAAADNRGNWDRATSPGFEGDKSVWTGDVSGTASKVLFQQTVTKKSDKEWKFVLDTKAANGTWAPTSEVTCKK